MCGPRATPAAPWRLPARLTPGAAQRLNGSCSGSPPLPLREGARLGPLSLPAWPAAACTCGAAPSPWRNIPTFPGVRRAVPTGVCLPGSLVLRASDLHPLSLGNPDQSCRQPSFSIPISPSIFTEFRLPALDPRRCADRQKRTETLLRSVEKWDLSSNNTKFLVCLIRNVFCVNVCWGRGALDLNSLVSKLGGKKKNSVVKLTSPTIQICKNSQTTQSSSFLLMKSVHWSVSLGKVGPGYS